MMKVNIADDMNFIINKFHPLIMKDQRVMFEDCSLYKGSIVVTAVRAQKHKKDILMFDV